MVVRLFSPFAGTYSKLDLQWKWWHRLAFVGLILCVAGAFALTLALTLWPDIQVREAGAAATTAEPAKSEHGPWEQYAEITSLPTLPKGYNAVVILSGRGERIEFPADTTKGALMRALCDHLKQGDEACWQVVSKSPAQTTADPYVSIAKPILESSAAPAARSFRWAVVRDIGIALAVSLAVSYLLQLAYRAVIFVAFGKPSPRTVAS